MKKIIYILAFLITFCNIAYALDTVSTKFYPLKIGNSWTYNVYDNIFPPTYRVKWTVTGTSIQNGHLYYYLENIYYRVDSLFGRLLKTASPGCSWTPNEMLVDSLSSKQGDTCFYQCYYFLNRCIDTSHQSIFGLTKPSKFFNAGQAPWLGRRRRYAKDIGLSYLYDYQGGARYIEHTLVGCVLNGIVYGDTTITGTSSISQEIPSEFKLSQNYPNPFNPSTKIKFDTPPQPSPKGREQWVRLIVYDILGREITTLVNQQLNPGTYEVEWDASNFPSGVYFYKLVTDDFTETRKMVLVK